MKMQMSKEIKKDGEKIDRRKLNLPPTNSKGRPKGAPNKVTASIRAAVERAAREVTTRDGKRGLTEWMLERARGGIQDRALFVGLVKAALPLKVDATVQSIQINLGWLAARPIDAATSGTMPPVMPPAMPSAIEASPGADGQDVYTGQAENVDKSTA